MKYLPVFNIVIPKADLGGKRSRQASYIGRGVFGKQPVLKIVKLRFRGADAHQIPNRPQLKARQTVGQRPFLNAVQQFVPFSLAVHPLFRVPFAVQPVGKTEQEQVVGIGNAEYGFLQYVRQRRVPRYAGFVGIVKIIQHKPHVQFPVLFGDKARFILQPHAAFP